ncbi:MAG: TlpA disulfide reductase family protein [Halioglobus sp.]
MIHNKKYAGRCGRIATLILAAVLLTACGEQRFQALEAENFTLPRLDGSGELSLEDFRGDVVYLSFWASWCQPCRQEMPYLKQLWQRHEGEGFQVLAINVESDSTLAKDFAQQFEMTFPVLWDPQRKVSSLYRVPGFPTHYIVDRSGRIRYSGLGFNLADVGALGQEVETLLAESADGEG